MWRWARPSESGWRGATGALMVVAGLLYVRSFAHLVVSTPTLGTSLAFLGLSVGTVAVGLVLWLVLWLLNRIPHPFRLIAAAVLPITALALIGAGGPSGLAFLGGTVGLGTCLVGGGLAALRRDRRSRKAQGALVAGLALAIGGTLFLFSDREASNLALADYSRPNRTLELSDPSQPGSTPFELLTYGPAADLHRQEFAEGVAFESRGVDGSDFVDGWDGLAGWARTRYWGFDVTELPIQGRLYLPDGPGPFPLVLIVHGNHWMEDHSDAGYGYLGELFASRGTAFASVDENFLNSSFSDLLRPTEPGLQTENDARAWLLLEHLSQFEQWNETPGIDSKGG